MANRDQITFNALIKAELNIDDIKNIVLELYGLKVKDFAELNGYDDKNYHIQIEECLGTANKRGCGYVFKIINSLDSKNGALFEAQTLLLIYLGKKGIQCPRPIRLKNGDYFTKIKLRNVEHIVRLFDYIDGKIIDKVPYTSQLLYQVGEFVSRIDEAMKGFQHEAFSQSTSIWKLDSVPSLRDYVFAVENKERKQMCTIIIQKFEEQFLAKSDVLEQGLIHGDVNEQNILVEKVGEDYQIKAIIDFGDCYRGYYLFELAITMAYMILYTKDIIAGAYILEGYGIHRKLSKIEYSLLKICIAARLCQSLVLGAYFSRQDPNNSYILLSSAHGWDILEALWEIPEDELLDKWRIAANKRNSIHI